MYRYSMVDQDSYITIRLRKDYYGERIDKFLEENPQFTSRADAVREIIRRFMEKHDHK